MSADDDKPGRTVSAVRVLVVDDNAATVMATVKLLEHSGYEAQGAMSGAQALDAAASCPPDAVLLDLGLPDLDGFSVLGQMREQLRAASARPAIFVAVSGRSDEETRARARTVGFAAYLVKPARLEDVLAVLPPAPLR